MYKVHHVSKELFDSWVEILKEGGLNLKSSPKAKK